MATPGKQKNRQLYKKKHHKTNDFAVATIRPDGKAKKSLPFEHDASLN